MVGLPLIFSSPWLLAFLALLPVIWWLLRLTPPSPRKIIFPALGLLRDSITPQQTPARTPWWLLLLRLLVTALVIVALAQPLIDAQPPTSISRPLLLLIDNDWASGRDWPARQKMAQELLHDAGRAGRQVMLLPMTPSADGDTLHIQGPMAAQAAEQNMAQIAPMPWPSDWVQVLTLLQHTEGGYESVWLASGLGDNDAKALYGFLQGHGGARVFISPAPIYSLQPPQSDDDDTVIPVLRADADPEAEIAIAAIGSDGRALAHVQAHFSAGAPRTLARQDIPADIRNQTARFEIERLRGAGSTVLLDTSWEHRSVGLVGDQSELDQHPLLSSLFYIDRALKPFADLHVASLDDLLKQKTSVLIIPDNVAPTDNQIAQLSDWVKAGGVLVRFAGDRLAASNNPKENALLPVNLRSGDRAMGGSLSWTTPQKLQDFPAGSPFLGLTIPPDVTVTRQILAEPAPDVSAHSWASLQDGTPLVTGKNLGQGTIILFHVPAKSDWSNLPLSGLFVSMLQRILDLAKRRGTSNDFNSLPPLAMLTGFGELQKPDSAAQPVSGDDFSSLRPGPQHPPGLYGTAGYNRAFNLGTAIGQPEALKSVPTEVFEHSAREIDLRPALLTMSCLLLLLDFILSLMVRGFLPTRWKRSRTSAAILLLLLASTPTHAANDPHSAVELTGETVLAYMQTGNREIDHLSETGLLGLAHILQHRTSMDQIAVTGISPGDDDLAFFPLIYWPILSSALPLSPLEAQNVNDYLHHGGMILFDTQSGELPAPNLMQRALAGVDIPPLMKLPPDHVLKHSFYLLDDFPGRYADPDFWLEPENLSSYDGVATVLVGSNDWAAAWAMDDNGRPLYPCIPGGEMQRERAFRFGVNLAMYALTGNYKADQVHAQELLKRMGK